MKILTCMFMVAATLAAQDQPKPPAQPPAKQVKPAKKTQKSPAIAEIPKDAVETAPGFYSWTDTSGKVWTYRRTPFGVTRWPAESMYNKQDVADAQITATEQGDSIRFERSSPFGKRTWVRKKTELSDAEKAIWESRQKNSAPSRPADKE
ncbi:MAG TPA: hypothetical protein VKR61_05160 [Bryobacteraceae bacterium]|nr:hypothetical protein [Bryobacteraceae bacterium]